MSDNNSSKVTIDLTKMTFEAAVERLEELAQALEDGEISIESSLAAYEEGQTLFKYCQQKLQDAEKKLRKFDELTDGNS